MNLIIRPRSLCRTLLACVLLTVSSCAPSSAQSSGSSAQLSGSPAPQSPREFRAAWVATVGNINWPSKPGLPVEQQKQEAIAILDRCAALNLNAIILQVRPAADAMYQSSIEPWSQYLTGVQGQPPSPFYDPLNFWITETHKRGMELHAWFNPYRAKSGTQGAIAANSIARTHPNVVKKYGNYLWMDPGEPIAARQTLNVILDIVRRYDVDGIHTDDYYYPYKVKENDKIVDFPDEPSWQRYRRAGGKLSRDDWRRDNVNQLVERIYAETKKLKPWVKVSYAPFGIWQPGHPPGIKGLNQYAELYADAKLWLNKGWLDFMSPQLYWKIGGDQDFNGLLNWWLSENTQQRYIWPGMSVARHSVEEVHNQIALTRKDPRSTGQVLWSVRSVIGSSEKSRQLYESLQRGPYAQKSLVPSFDWLDKKAPPAPAASVQRSADRVTVSLRGGRGEPAFVFGVWARYGDQWHFTTVPGGAPNISLNADASGNLPNAITLTAVDRCGNESERVNLVVR